MDSSSEAVFMGISLVVGIGTGLAAVIFNYLIQGMGRVGFEWFPSVTSAWGPASVVIVPTIGGLLIGQMIYFYACEANWHEQLDITIRCDRKVLIPHGETKLQTKDQLTAFIQSKTVERLYTCLRASKEEEIEEVQTFN